MYGPVDGKRHDCKMLHMFNILPKLHQYALDLQGQPFCIYGDPAYPLRVHLQGQPFCIYGDPAYPLRVHLQAPFFNPITANQKDFNKSMSQVRVSVEWLFGDIINWFKFLDFKLG